MNNDVLIFLILIINSFDSDILLQTEAITNLYFTPFFTISGNKWVWSILIQIFNSCWDIKVNIYLKKNCDE